MSIVTTKTPNANQFRTSASHLKLTPVPSSPNKALLINLDSPISTETKNGTSYEVDGGGLISSFPMYFVCGSKKVVRRHRCIVLVDVHLIKQNYLTCKHDIADSFASLNLPQSQEREALKRKRPKLGPQPGWSTGNKFDRGPGSFATALSKVNLARLVFNLGQFEHDSKALGPSQNDLVCCASEVKSIGLCRNKIG